MKRGHLVAFALVAVAGVALLLMLRSSRSASVPAPSATPGAVEGVSRHTSPADQTLAAYGSAGSGPSGAPGLSGDAGNSGGGPVGALIPSFLHSRPHLPPTRGGTTGTSVFPRVMLG